MTQAMTQKRRAYSPWHWQTLTAVVFAALLVVGAGCEPEIGNDPVPSFMEFDTATGRIPEPTVAAISQTTGMLDFGLLGYDVPEEPAACLTAAGWPSVAECEFFQYLETLDGYPTLSTMRTPANAALDPATITYEGAADDTLVVLEGGFSKYTAGDGLVVSFNDADNYLYIDNPAGWEIGTLYVGAVRGYDNGVVTSDGTRVVASVIYNLLKREESLLDCAPDAQTPPFYNADAVVDDQCKYYELIHEMYASQFPGDPDGLHATVVGLLASLEGLRQGYKGVDGITGMWDVIDLVGQMAKDEVAVAWAWPTHTQTTVELQPALGMVPVAEGNNILRLPFKGTIDASSLVPFTLADAEAATVFLLNATVVQQALTNPALLNDAILGFTPTLVGNELVLTADLPFIDGDRHIIMLTAKAEGDNRPDLVPANAGDPFYCGVCDGPPGEVGSRPIVPSPLTVYLRTRGALVDADGNSLVSKLDNETAVEVEESRLAMAQLFDEPLFASLTHDLIRENVAYVYAFNYVAP